MDSNGMSEFPNNYSQLLFEAIQVTEEEQHKNINNNILNITNKSNIYELILLDNKEKIINKKELYDKISNNVNIKSNKKVLRNKKNINNEKGFEQKKYKKIKMDYPKNGIDIEFPIIRNLNFNEIQDKVNCSIDSSNTKADYTNNTSFINNIILEDVTQKILLKNSNEISSNELTDANGSANDNNRNLRSRSNNNNNNNSNSNSSRSFNTYFGQLNRNMDKNFKNFDNNNNSNENNRRDNNNNVNEESGSSNTGKSKITNKEIKKIRCHLRRATVDCSERGLFQASKWAAEQLNSITKASESLNKYRIYRGHKKIKKGENQSMEEDKNVIETMEEDENSSDEECDIYYYSDSEEGNVTNNDNSFFNFTPNNKILSSSPSSIKKDIKQPSLNKTLKYPHNPKMTYKEYDKFLFARSLFDIREFDRASYILNSLTHPKCIFLRLYSKFMAGEKRKEEEVADIIGLNDNTYYMNKEILEIEEDLIDSIKNNPNDGFLFYLYGVLCVKKNQKKKAIQLLTRSVKLYPYNWSAWLELASCLITQELITSVLSEIDDNIMSRFFMAHLALEYQNNNENFETYIKPCLEIFDDSNYIRSQYALSNYHAREFEESEQYFDKIIKKDPYTLENMDIFSHVLYVTEKTTKLSYLAHNCCMIDKYRQETCCIIGNYYSLRGEHEKLYFIFNNYLSAWTLMGHEYIELKNTQAAIESYRRAIDLSQRDYRAWYGLGQIYEVLRMPYYSLYYYQQAASLRPYDSRMWVALAQCYDYIDHSIEAIKCYKRALIGGDSGPIVLIKLANLYAKLGNIDTAAYYYRLSLLEYKKLNNIEDSNYQEGCIFMANYYKKKKNYSNAEKYLQDVLHTEEGKSLIKELRSLQMAEVQ
ncbi:anaphase promoting complex subunit 8 [Neocallimastix lanati (nom. inval.)]|nr:anaphase promoting complex subunit 8 [Neocallimastix sp. JGI-2020a]